MGKLHPTLWRTCRILAGKTRLELLRAVINSPDLPVADHARNLNISPPRTSQELRRLQSRGLIQARRRRMTVRYRPEADPLVATAAPLLQALQETFRRFPATADGQAILIATAFAHARRLVLVRLLLLGPATAQALEELSGMARDATNRHLLKLNAAGIISRTGRQIQLLDPSHPLAQCLLDILRVSQAPKT
jgi:DNA-binding transcriptional ArsR family regulator